MPDQEGPALWAAILVAYSGLLRVFPGFMFLGPIFIVIQQVLDQTKGRKWWQRLPPNELPALLRKVERSHLW